MRDMYEQFQNIMKMGPFSQIMVSSLDNCLIVTPILCYGILQLYLLLMLLLEVYIFLKCYQSPMSMCSNKKSEKYWSVQIVITFLIVDQ